MIYVFKYIYTWLLPPAIFVLLLLWLSWRLWRKARNQAWLALAISALLYDRAAGWRNDGGCANA